MRAVWGIPLLLCAAGGGLAAQDPQVASPFHAGDWEVQSSVGSNLQLGNFSLLKYSTPTAAWYLFAELNATKPHLGGPGGISPMPTPGYNVLLDIGRRYFRPVTSHALLFATPTLDLGAQHSCNSSTSACDADWSVGIGLDLGGEYLVTPFLGVGVLAGGFVGYDRDNHLSGGVTTTVKTFRANLSTPFGLIAFLHF